MFENENVEAKLYGNGTIWFTSVNGWSGKDRLQAEDIGKDPDDIDDIIELGRKKLIPKATQDRINRPNSQITSLMKMIRAESFFLRGAWWVPDSKFMQAKVGLEKIREDHKATAVDLANNLQEIKDEMIEQYPILADAKWPTESQILKRFNVTWHVCQIKGASVNETDPEELAQAKLESRKQLTEAYNEYADQILEQAKATMFETIQDISEKIRSGQKITEASMSKPRRVIDDYANIAGVFDLNDLKVEIEKLKAELEKTNAASIRGNWKVAQEFADNIREMANNIGDISGLSVDGSTKRRIKFDKAA